MPSLAPFGGGVQRVVLDDGGDLPLEVECTTDERFSAAVALTHYPVESGVEPTDHSTEEPERLELEGFFSNTPTSADAQAALGIVRPSAAAPGAMASAGLAKYLASAQGGPGAPRAGVNARQQLEALLKLKASRRAVAIRTPLRRYESMLMVELKYTRDAKTGDALSFTAAFQQVRFVNTQALVVANKAPGAALGKQEHGHKTAEVVDPNQTNALIILQGGLQAAGLDKTKLGAYITK